MTSFHKLWENMHFDSANGDSNDKSLDAIRIGIGINEKFWDDFIKITNNSEALASLLDIPSTKINKWRERIKEALELVQKMDSSEETKKNTKLLKTGMPES